jgi:hypothetical protein
MSLLMPRRTRMLNPFGGQVAPIASQRCVGLEHQPQLGTPGPWGIEFEDQNAGTMDRPSCRPSPYSGAF